jgi:hypothetical protein
MKRGDMITPRLKVFTRHRLIPSRSIHPGANMNITRERFTKVIVPIVNAALMRGLIDKAAPWLPLAPERNVRFEDTIDGDIPIAVDVGRWRDGLSHILWALWPVKPGVPLQRPVYYYEWPGDVWGWATIDRRSDLWLEEFGEFRCRRKRLSRIDAMSRTPLDGRVTTRL